MAIASPIYDVIIIGSGMASLSAACMLAHRLKLRVLILEQNFLPGGCTSAYPRKGYVFESGATTLVGLDEGMALKYLLQETGIEIKAWPLELGMQVHQGQHQINRYSTLNQWIEEVQKYFPHPKQADFWTLAQNISQKVWQTSLQQLSFPPTSFADLWRCVQEVSMSQISLLPYLFRTTADLLRKFELYEVPGFKNFVNEQLLITAQNHAEEVNALFGCTALCYTLQKNFYVEGGLINLVKPFVRFLEEANGQIVYRQKVLSIHKSSENYTLTTDKGQTYSARIVLSGIPLNNTLPLLKFENSYTKRLSSYLLESSELVGAFQMGVGFENFRDYDSIHHQIHLSQPLPLIGSKSIFLSLSHPQDFSRTRAENHRVASVSTHIHDPAKFMDLDKSPIEAAILDELDRRQLITAAHIRYVHSSGPSSWEHWTQRAHGSVGGYPQLKRIKPWQMKDARLDGEGLYICGDSTYPGQGIPGVTLSGLIAFQKIKQDHF